MDILVITWNFPPRRGGIENLISQLVAGLRERNSVSVITTYVGTPDKDRANVFRAPCPGLIPFALYAIWRGAWLLCRNREPTVVFGGSAVVAPVVWILARLFGRKAVVQTHGLDLLYSSAVYQLLCVRRLKYCECIIANSTYTASLAKRAGVPEHRITVIPPGVDTKRLAAAANIDAVRRDLALEEGKTLLFVGRLARRKGVKEFIEKSFVKIVQEIPRACLVIVGDNPLDSLAHREDVLSEIQATVVQLGLQDHVRLLGAVTDEQLITLYQLCDVVILPVLACKDDVEGFGIVLLEAAAAAKPTVATRVGGIPDAVEDGKSGILVEPGDYEGLIESIIRLLQDDALHSTFGHYGSKRVRENFGWEKITERYEQALALAIAAKQSE